MFGSSSCSTTSQDSISDLSYCEWIDSNFNEYEMFHTNNLNLPLKAKKIVSKNKTFKRNKIPSVSAQGVWPAAFIMSECKLLVSITVDHNFRPQIIIRHKNSNFDDVFNYNNQKHIQFSSLLEHPNHDVMKVFENGNDYCNYIRLFTRHRVALACHVVVKSLNKSDITHSIEDDPKPFRKWAVVFIRSATAVGNTRLFSIGLTDYNQVLPAVKERLYSSLEDDTEYQPESELLILTH
jgi:hypothetical protein